MSDLDAGKVIESPNGRRLAELLGGDPEKYPWALEVQYERIFARILELWDSPEELLHYFDDLLVDKRGQRQGFPMSVAKDIFVLSNAYEKHLRQLKRPVQTKNEAAIRELEDEYRRPFVAREFHRAIERDELDVVALFLDGGMDVDSAQEGWTPLLVATFNGKEAVAELLLQKGADYKTVDTGGYTPLHWAAFNGMARVCRQLLSKRLPVDCITKFGWTPLMQASARGHLEVVQLLLDQGADIDHADQEGWTALHKAIANKNVAVAQHLLRVGAKPMARHKSGITPVMLAKEKGLAELFGNMPA